MRAHCWEVVTLTVRPEKQPEAADNPEDRNGRKSLLPSGGGQEEEAGPPETRGQHHPKEAGR